MDELENPPRTLAQNLRVLVPVIVLQSVVYLTLNHFQWVEPRRLPVTFVDDWFPFWPWSVIPYMVFFLSGFPVALMIQSQRVLFQAVWAYLICLVITVPIFVVWPTVCPRPELVDSGPAWSLVCYQWLTQVDTPACSFPSMHIMLPTIVCWTVWRENRAWKFWYIAGMLLLSLTILTTKQHYAWDWLGGLLIAVIGILIAKRT